MGKILNTMNKSNEEILNKIGYDLIKENPDTGWIQIVCQHDNTNFFWIPKQVFEHLMKLSILEKNMSAEQIILAKRQDEIRGLEKKVEEFRKKTDSQRKSIVYYKGERDSLQYLHNKMSEDCKARIQAAEKQNDYLEGLNFTTDKMNIEQYEEIQNLARRNGFLSTICIFLVSILVILLLFLAI